MQIYKIFRATEWEALCAEGQSAGAPIDLQDGYIHFSTAAQAPETAAKYFAGQEGLILAALDPATLGPALRWEPARGGQLFPHLYRALQRREVLWAAPLPLGPKCHIFPPDLS